MEVELVGIAFAMHFRHDIFVIVVAQRTAQLVIVHVGLALTLTPSSRHFIWICHFKLAIGPFPSDAPCIGTVGQELQKELPKLDLT